MIIKKILTIALAASTFLQTSVHAKDGFPATLDEEKTYKQLIGNYQDAIKNQDLSAIQKSEQAIESTYGGCDQFLGFQQKTHLTYAEQKTQPPYAAIVNVGCIYTLLAQDEVGGKVINYMEKYDDNLKSIEIGTEKEMTCYGYYKAPLRLLNVIAPYRMSTLLHELTHAAMHSIFRNACHPYLNPSRKSPVLEYVFGSSYAQMSTQMDKATTETFSNLNYYRLKPVGWITLAKRIKRFKALHRKISNVTDPS